MSNTSDSDKVISVSIRFSPDLLEKAKEMARKRRRSFNQEVILAVEERVQKFLQEESEKAK